MTTDRETEIADLLAGHEPVYWTHGDGSPVGCQCMDRVFIKERETWASHLATVLAAYIDEDRAEWENHR